jgi:uncharacterized phiE125 gp8 family phage protein
MSIPLSTIKTALKIDYSDDDADLIRLRETATAFVEKRTGLALQPRSEALYLSWWTDSLIPVAPYTGITHVRYQNSTNTQTTMPSGDYWIDQTDGPLNLIRFLEHPEIYEGTAITVTYTVGYSNIPDPLVHAMIALVGHWYNNPEAAQPIGLQTVPMSVDAIMDLYSVRSQLR